MAKQPAYYVHPPKVRQGDGDTQEFIVHPLRLFKDLIRDGRTITAYRDSFWVIDAGAGWYDGAFVKIIWRRCASKGA